MDVQIESQGCQQLILWSGHTVANELVANANLQITMKSVMLAQNKKK